MKLNIPVRRSTFLILLIFASVLFILLIHQTITTSYKPYKYLPTVIVGQKISEESFKNERDQYDYLPFEREFKLNFSCDDLFKGDINATLKAKQWQYQSPFKNDSDILDLLDNCSSFKKYFSFPNKALSEEEIEFPLAYELIVYKNPEQVIRMLSSVYWPQNLYCITYDTKSSQLFKDIMNKLPTCFPNLLIPKKQYRIDWCKYGVLQAAISCLEALVSRADSNWRYFQYLSGTDVPLKTNLEMVRIFKALNGSFNININPVINKRIAMLSKPPPGNLTLFKSSFSATFSRESAEVIINNDLCRKYLEWLNGSVCSDESYWSTVAGNPEIIQMPGGFPGQQWLEEKLKTVNTNRIDFFYISRYQVWESKTARRCSGYYTSGSCVFGVGDLPQLLNRKELVAHKLYMNFQPAAYFCLLDRVKQRTKSPIAFDTNFYSNLPGPRYLRANGKFDGSIFSVT